ncbi:hypothetical protein GCM10010435_37780 [Winogradskya consettensis]|uniref:Uncharacterized protein n=2 Tax=Winogradskya consettensis TaxID=113560 RepID=A0A919T142_9ACTN|nr:hypothetical protein Aco04nite_88310 [Actinoplanes consettensis]
MFIARPIDAVAGLFPDRAHAEAAVASLLAAGFAPFSVRPQQPDRCRLQDWGRDTTIMNLYLEGRQQGHVLLIVPAGRADRERVGRLLSHHHGHAVYHFTAAAVESLSILV